MIYPLKVWLTTLILAPVLIMLYLGIKNSVSLTELRETIPILFIIFYGMFLSLPGLLIFLLAYWELCFRSVNPLIIKIILCIIGVTTIWMTFYAIGLRFTDPDALVFGVTYSLTLIGSSFLFMIKSANTSNG